MQFDGETDKQTAALQCESAGKSVNRGSVLPGGWGGVGCAGLRDGGGEKAGGGWSGIRRRRLSGGYASKQNR